jgi:hypothetical protein
VRQSALGLWNNPGYVGTHHLGSNYVIIACNNDDIHQKDVQVEEVQRAALDRGNHYIFKNDLNNVINYLSGSKLENLVSDPFLPLVKGEKLTNISFSDNYFAKFLNSEARRAHLPDDLTVGDEFIQCTPRNLERAIALCSVIQEYGLPIRSNLNIIQGAVGKDVRNDFLAWLSNFQTLDPEQFFEATPTGMLAECLKVKDSSNVVLLSTACSEAFKRAARSKESSKIDNMMSNLERVAQAGYREVVTSVLTLVGVKDEFETSKEFQDVFRKHLNFVLQYCEDMKL